MTHQYPPTNHRNDVTRIDSEFCSPLWSPFIENLKSLILKYLYRRSFPLGPNDWATEFGGH